MTGDLAPCVALCLIPGLGSKTLARLLDHFTTLDAILSASESDLRAVPRIGPKLAAAIRAVDLERTRAEIDRWLAAGITILLRDDPAYPAALGDLPDAPPVLFRRGEAAVDTQAVAIVGTRHPTPESRQQAQTLAGQLAAHGWTVISGLAAGIDAAAHRGALDAGGRTVDVLGSGVSVSYPPENAALMAEIVHRGTLFSEVHPGAPPDTPALVARNRLISGLSRAVVVIEAGETSGSLHAARFATAQGRRVYAVQSEAAGNRQLLASGVSPLPATTSAGDRLVRDLDTLL